MATTDPKYPGKLSQSTGGNYATWNDLNNIKNGSSSNADSSVYGKSAPIQTGQPNKPSKIIATNFGFAIPTGAKINKIHVEYRIFKTGWTNQANPSIPAPTLSLKNVSTDSIKGYAPTNTETTFKATFNNVSKLKVDDINNTNFGVELDFAENTNEDSGRVFLYFLRITIDYTPLDYSINIRGFNPVYVGDTIPITINATDKNSNGYDPTVEINLPQWVAFTNANGQGTITQQGNKLFWKVPFSQVGMGASITLYFIISNTMNNVILTVEEPLTHAGDSFIFNIVNDPSTGWAVEVDDTNIVVTGGESGKTEKIYVTQNTVIPISLLYPENEGVPTQMHHDTKAYSYSLDGGNKWNTVSENSSRTIVIQDNATDLRLKYSTLGKRTVTFKSSTGGIIFKKYEIYVTPNNPGVLSATVLKVEQETLDLMADDYVYTAQTYLKLNSVVANKEFYDCGRNCRMLIFNAEIPSDTTDKTKYMIENAEFVSDVPSVTNTYQITSCDFIYHEEYDLYIIFTSDYSALAANGFDLQYASPAIIEKIVYHGYELYGNYPYPVNNVLSNSSLSEIKIPLFKQSNSFVLSKWPLPEWFGTIDDTAVVGIQLDLNLEYADECVCYAKLHAPDGRVGTRSVILNNPTLDNNPGNITIGGINDLFGFDVLDIQDFNKWELELQFNNIFTNEDAAANINFNKAALTLYTAYVEERYMSMIIDGKDMRYYGLYLEEVDIPEGLETDTKYLDIDGTDTNEAYRMNIDKKTITVKFYVDGCDIDETTLALRRIAKMLVNKRDSLNRPIPKRVEFTHYPDVHWNYIITDAFDADIDYGDYEVKIKLIVPSGTANSNEDQITNNIGVNNSLAKVNPLIQIVPTGSEIQITEKYSQQKFEITNTSLHTNDIVLIDCINRKVTVKKGGSNNEIQDISSSVLYGSDWFILHGEFMFETVGCMLQTVTFTERW